MSALETAKAKGLLSFFRAASPNSMSALKRAKAKGLFKSHIEEKNNLGSRTPLIRATMDGRVEDVKLLLEAGANASAKDQFGGTPLHIAVREDNVEIAKLLLGTAEGRKTVVMQDHSDGDTPLHWAVNKGDVEIAKLLLGTEEGRKALGMRDVNGYTPLHKAVNKGKVEIVELLLGTAEGRKAAGMQNKDGKTPRDVALLTGNSEIVRCIDKKGGIEAGSKEEEEEEEERRAAALAAMENRSLVDTFQPTDNVVKGMCGKCRQPVYSTQPRRQTSEGLYVHMMADGITEGCPSPPGVGTFNVATLKNDQVPQPAAAQYDQGINYPPPASPTVVDDGLQDMSLGGSGSPEDVRPPTLAQSNFRKLYHQGGSRPDMKMHHLFYDLEKFLIAHCDDIGVGRDPAIKMLDVLQREVMESVKKYGADNALDSASLARYLWTSGAILEGSDVPREHQVEFCSILNSIIRRDRPGAMKEAVRMVECINSLLVGSRGRLQKIPDEVVVFPSVCNLEGPAYGLPASYRGAGLPIDKLEFYQGLVGKSFRVSGLLATSLSTITSNSFMNRARENGLPAAMYIITHDPRGKDDVRYTCKHVNYVNASNVSGEAEYLFAPYSPFTVKEVRKGTGSLQYPHEVYLEAGLDSLDFDEELPVTPWI